MNDLGPVRFSHLRAYGKSALHGHYARTRTDEETNAAMQRGTAVHAILFGTRKVCGYPGKVRNGKQFDAFVLEHPETEILTMADFDKARRMADAVLACKDAGPLLAGVREETIRFRWNALQCRSTPDVRGADFITELKSASTVDPMRFPWHATRRMHYHAQMRLESIATRVKTGTAPLDCFIVAVEQNPPHPVQCYRIEERALEEGEKMLMLWSEALKVAEQSGVFPPYTTSIVPLDIPEDEEEAALVFAEEEPVARGGRFSDFELGSQP